MIMCMRITKIARKKRSLLYEMLSVDDAVTLEITTNNLGATVFDFHVWRSIYKHIFYNKDFQYIVFEIPSENTSKFFDTIEYRLNEEERFQKSINYFGREKLVKDWREKVKFTVSPTLNKDGANDWAILSVTKHTIDGVRETREIER